MSMFKKSFALLMSLLFSDGFGAEDLLENLVGDCAVDFDPSLEVDYFPSKYSKPIIKSYGDVDIFGSKFVPHNTTDFLEISYHKNYKIVTNKHQDPPRSYLLYQCGTRVPQEVLEGGSFDLVLSVPHRGGVALTQTPQIPYLELLGMRKEIVAYVGNPIYVTSPCLSHMMSDEAAESNMVETVYDRDSATMASKVQDFRERRPDAIIVSGPTNNVVGERVIVASTTQERTNVATFDWIHFYAAFFNMEKQANQIAQQMQDSYDCSSDVAKDIAKQQRQLPQNNKKPTIMWANYFTYQNLGWSVAEFPTWDTTYYCEYAEHCGATVLSRPPDFGYNRTWGSPTVYWYLNDEEVLAMGKNADVFIFSGADWDSIYNLKNETLDQFKAVQNKMVFDTLGQGRSAWNEQRYAEYDVVGLDMCDVVGRTPNDASNKHQRRWFRNVYTEPIGSMEPCDVEGGDIDKPFVPPGQECVRPEPPTATTPTTSPTTNEHESSAATFNMGGLVFAMLLIACTDVL
jgi:hypothetical protein